VGSEFAISKDYGTLILTKLLVYGTIAIYPNVAIDSDSYTVFIISLSSLVKLLTSFKNSCLSLHMIIDDEDDC